jgi:hypothetical protein
MWRVKNGELLTNKTGTWSCGMERTFWRTLERRLRIGATNTSSQFERDDRVDIDLPSRKEIEGALKWSSSKTVDLIWWMHYMQWSSRPRLARHYREARPRGYCVQCTRRAMNSIVKTIERFASWTWCTKYSPKFYTTASCPTLTWPFSITRLGSNQVNQQQTNSLHCTKS